VRPFAYNYDAVYSDKDYDAEIGVLRHLIAPDPTGGSKILEIGAGTGNHTLRLASLFRQVVAIEIDQDFASIARTKISSAPNIQLVTLPVQDLRDSAFDAAAAFFNVLNYVSPEQMDEFLDAISSRLKPGCSFVTDLMNGEAVLADPPRAETRTKRIDDANISQQICPFLDVVRMTLDLNYTISVTRRANVDTFSEKLKMYLWRLDELQVILGKVGFRDVQFWDRRKFPAPATDTSWQVWMRATRS
jgi:predicted O-methyltransferase YrrM